MEKFKGALGGGTLFGRGGKAVFLLVCIAVVLGQALPSPVKATSELQRIESQLNKVKRAMEEATEAEERAKREIRRLRGKKKEITAENTRLEQEIAVTTQQIKRLDDQIGKVEVNLKRTVNDLAVAKKRVRMRQQMLSTRITLMYTNGTVSYLDVLLSATSFEDFVARLEGLQAIVTQDESLLEANQRDLGLIKEKKEDIEAQLAYVETIFDKTTKLKGDLSVKKEKSNVYITQLSQKEDNLEEVTAEQERELMELADEQAKLLRQKRQLEEKTKKKPKKKIVAYTGGQLRWPVSGYNEISSFYGTRIHPITRRSHVHSGIDIPAPSGTTIAAAASGEVILARWYGGYGNTVIIEHKDGFRTLYAHIRTGGIRVRLGEEVQAGTAIAEVGSTGTSTGNHLHFGVYVNNQAVDPLPYLQ